MVNFPCFINVPATGIVNPTSPGKQSLNLKKAPGKSGILIFKMDTCPHCVNAMAALHDWSERSRRPVYVVDAQSPIVGKFVPRITGFPAIYVVDSAGRLVPEAYNGQRTPEGFEQYVRKFE